MRRPVHRVRSGRSQRQGSISIFFALMIVFLFGAAGLAVDTARAYLGKAHVQNAADACALAAVGELARYPDAGVALDRARGIARLVVERHRVPFRNDPLTVADADITVTLPDGTAAGVPQVTCRVESLGMTPLLLSVFGVGERTMVASASATLVGSQSSCALPMGLRELDTGDAIDFGYVAGQWYPIHFGAVDNPAVPDFRWVEFDPDATVTDAACQGTGLTKAEEAACLVARGGKCDRPAPVAACSGAGVGCAAPVSGTGVDFEAVVGEAYNTRFGLYKTTAPRFTIAGSPPDHTGYAYDINNWTACATLVGSLCASYVGGATRVGLEAFNGSHGTSGSAVNYDTQRAAHASAQAESLDTALTAFYLPADFAPSTAAEHKSLGASRRLAVVPVIDRADWAAAGPAKVRGYACVLLLNPWNGTTGSTASAIEYLGNAASATSPCVASGLPGRVGGGGSLVPALMP